MNAIATPGCDCATCAYLRATAAPTPFTPTVNPTPSAPVNPWPPQGYQTGGYCLCGAWVGNMQVHTCPYSGVAFGGIAYPLASS